MKHLFYAFYVSFYAGAMFVAGLFVGQFMERRWALKEAERRSREDERVEEGLILDKPQVALSNRSTVSR